MVVTVCMASVLPLGGHEASSWACPHAGASARATRCGPGRVPAAASCLRHVLEATPRPAAAACLRRVLEATSRPAAASVA